MTIPPIAPSPAETSSVAARGRSSYERPVTPRSGRSRAGSPANGRAASVYSDAGSFRTSASDEEGSDDSDELDLDPEDIPVTGFAVASNKRNQDFHELFPSVPEGDYLIEGVCVCVRGRSLCESPASPLRDAHLSISPSLTRLV